MTRFKRHEFNLEQVHSRRLQKPVFDLREASEGELDYLLEIADLWKKASHRAIQAAGETLAVAIDVEWANREAAWNLEQARFDTLAAELTDEKRKALALEEVDTSDIPPWSEASATWFPPVADIDELNEFRDKH